MELLIGSAFALVALTLPTSNFFQLESGGVLVAGVQCCDARHRLRRFYMLGAAAA